MSGETALLLQLIKIPQECDTLSQNNEAVKSNRQTDVKCPENKAQCINDNSTNHNSASGVKQPLPKVAQRLERLITEFSDVFNGIGKLRDFSLKLHIDESVEPVSQTARRILYPMPDRVSKELQRLEEQGIIEDAQGPTPWVSPLVIAKDPESVRICVDMRCPNTAIRREKHVTPTVDDFIQALNGSTVFSKADLNSAYHQIELAENCRYIITFSSHVGLKSYTRLNYGTNSAAEIFDNIIRHIVSDIPGVQ